MQTDDVRAVHERLQASGVRVHAEPHEFVVRGADGVEVGMTTLSFWIRTATFSRSMSATAEDESRAGRLVWDLPLRAVHWVLMVTVAGAWVTHYAGTRWFAWHRSFGYATLVLVAFGWCGDSPARGTRVSLLSCADRVPCSRTCATGRCESRPGTIRSGL